MDEVGSPAFPVRDFAIALFIGALVGIEREKKASGQGGLAGIRTFILFAMVGATAAWIARSLHSPWPFVAGTLSVAALVVAGYVSQMRATPQSPGLTTEVAAVAVCLLAGTAILGYPELAVALGITVSAVLAFKEPIHGLVEKVGRDDIFAGLKLLIATFIVLPLLPDRTIDPWGAVNPYKTGWLVVLISAMSLLGYVAVRMYGTARGFALTGFFGGLVSSTAVTLGFARRSREHDAVGLDDALAAGVLLAWTVMFPRVGTIVVLLCPALLSSLWLPLSAMCLGTLGVTAYYLRRSALAARVSSAAGGPGQAALRTSAAGADVQVKNPFRIGEAVKFALFLTAILVVVALARAYLPESGLYVVAALAGSTDADAISLSMADMAKGGGDAGTASAAILIAIIANTVTKAGIAAALGSPGLRRRVFVGVTAAIVCGAAAALAM